MSVPVTKGQYASNETSIYTYLVNNIGMSKAAACGVLANIEHESSFNHTAKGDNGTSYGICQWHDTRWTQMKKYCSTNGLNPQTLKGQLEYLYYELRTSYKVNVLDKLISYPNTSQGAYDAASTWCLYFEIPADKERKAKERGNSAKNKYWSAYSNSYVEAVPMPNKGNLIVKEAMNYLGMPYVWGGSDPSTSFDCSGFIYYVYKKAIDFDWSRTTAYYQWKNYGGRVVSDFRAGDLIFFTDTYSTGNNPNISHIAIATGNGNEFIHSSSSSGVAISNLDNSYWKSHYYETKRLLEDGETSKGNTNYIIEGVSSSVTLSLVDTYGTELAESIEYVEEENILNYNETQSRYGYLLDLVNGGEFKFYVPEYNVDTVANWEDISILGRSASIKGYNSTSSRSLDIELELIAGAGLYSSPRGANKDRIQDLHDDIAFLQSLAYPDYSKAIVLPPPVVMLYLGPHLKMKGIVSNVRVNYMKPYDSKLRPMHAVVNFTVTHITDNPPDYYDVRNHSFEGSRSDIPSTYNNATDFVRNRRSSS